MMPFRPTNHFDRFIPMRQDLKAAQYQVTCPDINPRYGQPTDLLSQRPSHCHRRAYVRLLWSAMHAHRRPDGPIVNCSDRTGTEREREENSEAWYRWGVYPRRKPLIGNPECELDLPHFNFNLCMNAIDWSRTGYICTTYHGRIYMWSEQGDTIDEIINTRVAGKDALRWDNAGQRLAVSNREGLLIWSLKTTKVLVRGKCPCLGGCSVTVICWDGRDRTILTGCTKGRLNVMESSTLTEIRYINAHLDTIIALKMSAKNKYLCTSGMDCRVRVWHWPRLTMLFLIEYEFPVKALAFHPWQDSLLAVGGKEISLWNVALVKQLDYAKTETKSIVESLTWNPLTGEMITSHTLQTTGGGDADDLDPSTGVETNKILVLANLNKVVDTIVHQSGRVLYMLWNHDYTQLATGGSEENLCIWNYFGLETEKYRKKIKRERTASMFALGKCIR